MTCASNSSSYKAEAVGLSKANLGYKAVKNKKKRKKEGGGRQRTKAGRKSEKRGKRKRGEEGKTSSALLLFYFFKDGFIFMCMNVLPGHVLCMCVWCQRRYGGSSRTGVLDGCKPPYG